MGPQHSTATAVWLGLGWIDWILAVLMLVSVLVGLWRGLVYELLSLAAWLMAWLVALNWGPELATRLPLTDAGAAPRVALGYAAAFLGTLILGALLARLLRMLVAATPLRWIDRLLGAVFGIAFLLGPLLGGLLLRFSWHWLFLINVPIILLLIAQALRLGPANRATTRTPFDAAGAVLLSLLLAALAITLTN
ncbi:MAG: CvpA family protein, partial [Burkholderiales bacterium]|nr:CvpA family protein [Burkholderiales bacterium]